MHCMVDAVPRKVHAPTDLVQMAGYSRRKPNQLSDGQPVSL